MNRIKINSYDYILGDTIISNGINNDILYKIIEKKKHKLLKEIKGFNNDRKNRFNTGVHSENIVRLSLNY